LSGNGLCDLLADSNSTIVLTPPLGGKGSWVGAPSAFFDQSADMWTILVRYRDERKRGYKTVLYRTRDGIDYSEVKTFTAGDLDVASVERGAITRFSGAWRFYLSWECRNRGGWVIAVAENDNLEKIQPADFEIAYSGSSHNTDMIKDPVLYDGRLYAHVRRHGIKSTFLLEGAGLRRVVPKTVAWDRYCQRITSIIQGNGGYFAFYDGAESIEHNQEEKTGILYGASLTSFMQINHDSPALSSKNGSGSIRYLEAKEHGKEIWIWYERCTANWSHELCFLKVTRDELLTVLDEMKDRSEHWDRL
jgi:hypothetical protein